MKFNMDQGYTMEAVGDMDVQQGGMTPPERITCCGAVRQNYLEYSEETSCHGLAHIMDRGRGIARRWVFPISRRLFSLLSIWVQIKTIYYSI